MSHGPIWGASSCSLPELRYGLPKNSCTSSGSFGYVPRQQGQILGIGCLEVLSASISLPLDGSHLAESDGLEIGDSQISSVLENEYQGEMGLS